MVQDGSRQTAQNRTQNYRLQPLRSVFQELWPRKTSAIYTETQRLVTEQSLKGGWGLKNVSTVIDCGSAMPQILTVTSTGKDGWQRLNRATC